MMIQINPINPLLSNPFPPTIELIKKFVASCHPSDAVVDVDIRPLSGGLSGAVVALVTHLGQRHVAKIDKRERVLHEIEVYQSYLASKVDQSTSAAKQIAILAYPDSTIRSKGMDEVERSIISMSGYDNEQYSIYCFQYAKSDVKEQNLHTLDSYIQEKLKNSDSENLVEKFGQIFTNLSKTLEWIFYDRHPERNNFRKFELPAVPWEQLLPLAFAAASFHQGWLEFVKSIPGIWNQIAAKQEAEPHDFYLSHGDMRCANVMIISGQANNIHPFLIDFGLTGFENAMYDFARIEADLVQRVLLQEPEESIRSIIFEITESPEFNPDGWKERGRHFFLQMVSIIRASAARLFAKLPEGYRLECYELYLLGHAARMLRNDDPALRDSDSRYLFLWYVLRIFERVIKRSKPDVDMPELADPIDPKLFANLKKWELKQLYHGNSERNEMKKAVLKKDPGPIRLLAHTAYSYLDASANRFYKALLTRLSQDTDNNIKIIILNPYSLEGSKLGIAEARGLLQGPEVDCEYHEKSTELFSRFRKCLESYTKIKNPRRNLELRITHYSPDATILLSAANAFIEPYLIGNVHLRYHSEIGMTAPEYLVPCGSYLYEVANDHFDFFWKRAISVSEYTSRENEFKEEFMRSERLRRQIVSLHESWLAIDPIVGCPNRCEYCFLTPYRINNKAPYIYRTPKDSYQRLQENDWFKLQLKYLNSIEWQDERLPVPVACGNYTEMLHPEPYKIMDSIAGEFIGETNNITELHKIVVNHCKMGPDLPLKRLPILCLITKQHLLEDEQNFFLNQLIQNHNLRIAFFSSISFLPSDFEKGAASTDKLIENFRTIRRIQNQISEKHPDRGTQIAGIHFWRPIIPGKNTSQMRKNLARVREAGASSSVAIGLKLSEKLAIYLKQPESGSCALQGLLSAFDIKKDGYELFDPETRSAAVKTGKEIDHPVYLNTSCAVAHAFGLPDYNATFSDIGILSDEKRQKTLEILHTVGLNDVEFDIHGSEKPPHIEIKAPIEQEMQTYLRQATGIEVSVSDSLKSTHEWRGNASRLTNGEFCVNAYCMEEQRQICREYYLKNSPAETK